MAPDNKILGAISKEDQNLEIQRRLQEQETQKARALLASATSHYEALKITKAQITKDILAVTQVNGSKRK